MFKNLIAPLKTQLKYYSVKVQDNWSKIKRHCLETTLKPDSLRFLPQITFLCVDFMPLSSDTDINFPCFQLRAQWTSQNFPRLSKSPTPTSKIGPEPCECLAHQIVEALFLKAVKTCTGRQSVTPFPLKKKDNSGTTLVVEIKQKEELRTLTKYYIKGKAAQKK